MFIPSRLSHERTLPNMPSPRTLPLSRPWARGALTSHTRRIPPPTGRTLRDSRRSSTGGSLAHRGQASLTPGYPAGPRRRSTQPLTSRRQHRPLLAPLNRGSVNLGRSRLALALTRSTRVSGPPRDANRTPNARRSAGHSESWNKAGPGKTSHRTVFDRVESPQWATIGAARRPR